MIVPLAWAHDDYGRLLMKPLRHRAFFLGYRCPLHLLRARIVARFLDTEQGI
jgi:hypothetical protein